MGIEKIRTLKDIFTPLQYFAEERDEDEAQKKGG